MDELREKVVYSIERCISHVPDACRDCAYDDPYNECVEMMLKDALTLLKAVRPEKRIEQSEWNCCPKCGGHIISKWGYCPYCGQGVKWNGE